MGRHAEGEQSGSTADFQQSRGPQRQYPLHRAVHPDSHFFRWYWLASVAAIPASDVESRVGGITASAISLVKGRRPLRDLFLTECVPRAILIATVVRGIRNHIRYQT